MCPVAAVIVLAAPPLPAQVMSADEQKFYAAPEVPAPTVQLDLPLNRGMRAVVDRMKGECTANQRF